jgi:hypothetical protein
VIRICQQSLLRSMCWAKRSTTPSSISSAICFFWRGEPTFVAFDLLLCNGEDLQANTACREFAQRLLYCDHVKHRARKHFGPAGKRDREAIVAKRKFGPYLADSTQRFKIRNRTVAMDRVWGIIRARARRTSRLAQWNACAPSCDGTGAVVKRSFIYSPSRAIGSLDLAGEGSGRCRPLVATCCPARAAVPSSTTQERQQQRNRAEKNSNL